MGVFKTIGDHANNATHIAERYLKTTHQYYKLKFFKEIAFAVSMVSKVLLIGACIAIALIFAAVSGALFLGQLFNNLALGYVTMAGIFVLLAWLIYSNRHLVNTYVLKKMSANFFSDDDSDF
ncbi:hypothetical protein ACFSQP_01855 [Bizionia sediminis]|uniref:Phage holin family protein n=1 Tax=Bizionia sediminis TaxID=1737064 RepID=A0ABW5KRN2_9FLAO